MTRLMSGIRIAAGFLLLVPAVLALGIGPDKVAHRLRLVPAIGDELLFDLEESADGSRLLTNSAGHLSHSTTPRLWNSKTVQVLGALTGHSSPVFVARFSEDGKWILTASSDSLRVWDAKLGHEHSNQVPPTDQTFTTACINSNGSVVVAGTSSGKVYRYSLGAAPSEVKANAGAESISATQISVDGKQILTADNSGVVSLFDDDLHLIRSLPKHPSGVRWIEFSVDGKQAVTTGFDSVGRLFDLETGAQMVALPHVIAQRSVGTALMAAQFVGKDLGEVLFSGADGTMTLVDRHTGKVSGELKGHSGPIREIRRTRDGLRTATYGDDNELKIWDVIRRTETPFARVADLPTAADFSADGQCLWVGYASGNIRKHDLKTGGATLSRFSAVNTTYRLTMTQNDSFVTSHEIGTSSARGFGYEYLRWTTNSLSEPRPIVKALDYLSVSSDGRYAMARKPTLDGYTFWDVMDPGSRSHQATEFSNDVFGVAWEPHNSWFTVWTTGGALETYDSKTLEQKAGWNYHQKSAFTDCVVSPNGKQVAVSGLMVSQKPGEVPTSWAMSLDPNTGKSISVFGITKSPYTRLCYSPDGTKIAALDEGTLYVYDCASGNLTYELAGLSQGGDIEGVRPVFSSDGKRISLANPQRLVVVDLSTSTALIDVEAMSASTVENGHVLSPDGSLALRGLNNQVEVWDVAKGKAISRLPLSDQNRGATFTQDGTRVLTLDATDGMVIWDISKPADPIRLGSFIVMKDGSWLVMDGDGRYDAPDPEKVPGASYVLEWDGGQELIEVSQMKSRYFEPGLFQKLLGQDLEPRRAVPDVNRLKLFPEVTVTAKPSDPNRYTVGITARDHGGIGTVNVQLNGKRIMSKQNVGYFTVDLNEFRSFMLPGSKLPEGGFNTLAVEATNEPGDLVGGAVMVNLATPSDLEVPSTKLYALCAGVGKYLGDSGNLGSPPADARELGAALSSVGARLLKNAVEVTVLTTDAVDPKLRPSRTQILSWLDEVAKKATSSDIVMVFLAGHGTSAIGDHRDYFFLTPDCDPTDIDPALLGVATISGADLQAALAKVPSAKQVVILDTCHSGAAAKSLLASGRSLAGDYQRAYEAIRESTGTWILAGSASDQLSYESTNVDHGMLTYSLLEAIDRASADGLRQTESGDLFVDVEQWLSYAASRVESLKVELGVPGTQRPELKRSPNSRSFDLGVTSAAHRGELNLKAPRPVVLMGTFSQDEEDPLHLEKSIHAALKESTKFKPWFEIAAHPGANRVAGTYTSEAGKINLRLFWQKFDAAGERKTLQTVNITGLVDKPDDLAVKIRAAVENFVAGSPSK